MYASLLINPPGNYGDPTFRPRRCEAVRAGKSGELSGVWVRHTAVGRYGIVSKIISTDWQAGFPGSAGSAGIDFIGGNDQKVKNHLKYYKNLARRFDLRR